ATDSDRAAAGSAADDHHRHADAGALTLADSNAISVGLSLLGAGNIGGGVIAALEANAERYAARVGRPLELRRVLVRDASRRRTGVRAEQATTSLDDVLADAGTQIVIELMGGEEPARE